MHAVTAKWAQCSVTKGHEHHMPGQGGEVAHGLRQAQRCVEEKHVCLVVCAGHLGRPFNGSTDGQNQVGTFLGAGRKCKPEA